MNEVSVSLYHTYGPVPPNSELYPRAVLLGYVLGGSWKTCQDPSLALSTGLWTGQLALKNIKRERGHIASYGLLWHRPNGFFSISELRVSYSLESFASSRWKKKKRWYTAVASKIENYSQWSNWKRIFSMYVYMKHPRSELRVHRFMF